MLKSGVIYASLILHIMSLIQLTVKSFSEQLFLFSKRKQNRQTGKLAYLPYMISIFIGVYLIPFVMHSSSVQPFLLDV